MNDSEKMLEQYKELVKRRDQAQLLAMLMASPLYTGDWIHWKDYRRLNQN